MSRNAGSGRLAAYHYRHFIISLPVSLVFLPKRWPCCAVPRYTGQLAGNSAALSRSQTSDHHARHHPFACTDRGTAGRMPPTAFSSLCCGSAPQ